MVFAVYEQGMRIHTPRKTLLGRRGIDALQQPSSTRRLSDTDSDSTHLEHLAEQTFEQIQRSAIRRREDARDNHSQDQEDQAQEKKDVAADVAKKAIKAYSSTEQSHTVGQRPSVNAGMIMSTPIVSAPFDQNLQQGWRLMQSHCVQHLILMNRKGALMGMVSDKDILKLTSGVSDIELDGRAPDEVMLGDLISRKLLTVSPDASVLDIAHAMLEQDVSALPVVTAQDELKGIITRTDLLQAMINGKLETWY
ncbi:CBS domain-containing protein [Oceanospirillum maris]|uniref:CBS domain-containing protein n=1 Tax=Oceanospirillum maris TaxID=64977 RepID=UPI00040DFC4D|nr:CBS domain-containing protein [Oceanospirillum maris]